MRSVVRDARQERPAAVHMIWLPGAYHAPEDFLKAGFHASVAARGLSVDLCFVDLELRHLEDRDAIARLRREAVLPRRASGSSLWLAGISLGGFIALDYAATHTGDLDGVCVLAPYLGSRPLVSEIRRAGGAVGWRPGELAEDDVERRLWRFLQQRPRTLPLLHLGYGRADRFAAAHDLMASMLPPASVDVIDGGHDWPTWSRLWENFLDRRWA